jgi:ubiquinone/menaquinone biosynthesis C-methylase UbiE
MQYQYRVPPQNSHYEGVFDETERRWRQTCALDKASHVGELLGDKRGEVANVLEVGCGTGDVIARVSDLGIGGAFTGIDVTDPNLNNQGNRRANLVFVQQTGANLPFEDRSFDLVIASHVLEHVEDERSFLRELARVSRRYVYVEVPCELHVRSGYSSLQKTLDIGHINSYTPASFALTLATAGLSIECLRSFDHSLAVQSFFSGRPIGALKLAVRSSLLYLSESIATKMFTYHCGALCRVGP